MCNCISVFSEWASASFCALINSFGNNVVHVYEFPQNKAFVAGKGNSVIFVKHGTQFMMLVYIIRYKSNINV